MLAAQRILYIKNQLNSRGIVTIKEMSKELNVSEATIRRDFDKLEQKGVLVKVKGGATNVDSDSSEPSVGAELTISSKQGINMHVKNSVAKYAASLIEDHECVYVDGGTSCIPLIEALASREVVVVTPNIKALQKLKNPTAKYIVIGGYYLAPYGVSVGPDAQMTLRKFHFSRAFFGCSSVNFQDGYCYFAELDTPAIKQEALNITDHAYLLINSDKTTMQGFFRWTKLSRFDSIICNKMSSQEQLPANLIMVDVTPSSQPSEDFPT